MSIIDKHFLKQQVNNYRYNFGSNIKYYNFWKGEKPEEIWFSRFINSRNLGHRKKIYFFSVLGDINNIHLRKGKTNIFFSGENMYSDRFASYRAFCEKQHFDLYIDFTSYVNKNSIRFPLWLMYMFKPEVDYNDIKTRVEQLRYPKFEGRQRFCSLVASHDFNGIRGKMFDTLSSIDKVVSAGIFRNNSDELHSVFSDNKHDFIKQFKFNICPENSNHHLYVTEKIFQAIDAGCIPVYWGGDNSPECNILNKDAILFWNEDDNTELIKTVKEINTDIHTYNNFAKQPRLLSGVEDIVAEMFIALEKAIRDVIKN
jgi:hypothetical protein